jgi:hypothetical protein
MVLPEDSNNPIVDALREMLILLLKQIEITEVLWTRCTKQYLITDSQTPQTPCDK